MKKMKRFLSVLLCACAAMLLMAAPARAAFVYPYSGSHSCNNTAISADYSWVGAWSTSPVEVNFSKMLSLTSLEGKLSVSNLTFRTVVRTTLSGDSIRITLSNEYGTGPLTVNAVTAAKTSTYSDRSIVLTTRCTVTFDGCQSVTIPAGETVTSDAIPLEVAANESITISSWLKDSRNMKTFGLIGGKTYVSGGNDTNQYMSAGLELSASMDVGDYQVIPMLTSVEVDNPEASSVVVIGDSTLANDIPYLLSDKLQNAGITNTGVLQQAIKGNRLVADGAGTLGMIYGESMLNRFERDALNQSGVSVILIKVGMNDIIHPNCESMKGIAPETTTEEMIAAYKELIEAAHERGIRVYLFTRTAWNGYTRNISGTDDIQWSEELDAMRVELNEWIRSEDNPADGYIELDSLCEDEACTTLKSEYTLDGAHLSDAGQQALVDLIPLDIFQ
ncbi:MAG: GDSL-type esterase/lipase family protein [Clostridiales bacterium]|nr:GDSL-type esterase/lipase family protein [Clostridiales bacterium]